MARELKLETEQRKRERVHVYASSTMAKKFKFSYTHLGCYRSHDHDGKCGNMHKDACPILCLRVSSMDRKVTIVETIGRG